MEGERKPAHFSRDEVGEEGGRALLQESGVKRGNGGRQDTLAGVIHSRREVLACSKTSAHDWIQRGTEKVHSQRKKSSPIVSLKKNYAAFRIESGLGPVQLHAINGAKPVRERKEQGNHSGVRKNATDLSDQVLAGEFFTRRASTATA